jgi:hypothetical protein
MQQKAIEAAPAVSSEVPEVANTPVIEIPAYMIEELNAADEFKAMEAVTGKSELPPVEEASASVAADSFEVTVHGITYVAADGRLFSKKTNSKEETILVFVSSLIVVVAIAGDSNSSSWGKVFRFEDLDGVQK